MVQYIMYFYRRNNGFYIEAKSWWENTGNVKKAKDNVKVLIVVGTQAHYNRLVNYNVKKEQIITVTTLLRETSK